MAKAADSKTRRTAIRVVVFVGVLLALTCLGAVTFFQSAFGDLEDVPSLVSRAGRAAPPNVAVVDWFGNGIQLTQQR